MRLLFWPVLAAPDPRNQLRAVDPQLDDLQRQRAEVKQRLDGLDAQIAARRATLAANEDLASDAARAGQATTPSDRVDEDSAESSLVADYQAEAARSPARLKQGCWLLFVGVLAVSASAVAIAWYWLRRA